MVSGDNVTVTLTGGAPWGFRLTGGGSLPLQIAKIRKKSQAHAQGLKEGDAVVSINGIPVHDRTHDEAVDLIDNAGESLTLQIYRGDADDLGQLLASEKPHAPLFIPHDDEGSTPAARGVTSSTTSSHVLSDDGATRREVQQQVFVSTEGDSQSSTFVRKEQSVTTTTSSAPTLRLDDVNGNDAQNIKVGGGFTITTTVDVDQTSSLAAVNSPSPSPVVVLTPHPQPSFRTISPLTVDVGQTSMTASLSLSPGAALSPRGSPAASPKQVPSPQPPPVAPKPSLSPKPYLSPKPSLSPKPQAQSQVQIQLQSSPQLYVKPEVLTQAPRGPTFKALPPKIAPEVPPKPVVVGGQVVSSDPLLSPKPQFQIRPTFNAKAVAQMAPTGTVFSPGKFQVQATAMYSSPGSGFSPRAYSPGRNPQSFSPLQTQSPPQFASPPQAYSPASQQVNHAMQFTRQVSKTSTSSKQFASPVSTGSYAPAPPFTAMFTVRNNLGEGTNVWQPNMWLPGQEPGPGQPQQPPQRQQRQEDFNNNNANNGNVEVPRPLSVKERQQMLLTHTARTNHSLSARQSDPFFQTPPVQTSPFQAPPEEEQGEHHDHRLHVFGPPVEIAGPDGHLVLEHMDSFEGESEASSPNYHRRKMYSDSAFYEDPSHKYPTIEEQMKLCRLISYSLTSAANRRARGAKMFAKRRRRSAKWVHQALGEWGSSSAGDVANLEELDSELGQEEGGSRQLFAFRIPSLKLRVAPPEKNAHMALRKDEFERLRLQAQKCDHRTVPPTACFDIVADLKASKGRGGRLFERRKHRSDKFIIDESNARVPEPRTPRLEELVGQGTPLKSGKSPWQVAQESQDGAVDAAFDHLGEMERMAKLKRILHYSPPTPAPAAQTPPPLSRPPAVYGPKSSLRDTHGPHLLQGRNFNRFAKGWHGADIDSDLLQTVHHMDLDLRPDQRTSHRQAQQSGKAQYGDYNPRPRAWQPPQEETSSCPPSMSASWSAGDFDRHFSGSVNGAGFYASDELPASDL